MSYEVGFILKKDLAKLYQVSKETLKRWLLNFENELPFYKRYDKFLTPKQLEIIFSIVGFPNFYSEYKTIDFKGAIFLKNIANYYNIDRRTLTRYLKRIGINKKTDLFQVKLINEIYGCFGKKLILS